ncbi:hypothetical protein [Arthrobacter sp. LFS091]
MRTASVAAATVSEVATLACLALPQHVGILLSNSGITDRPGF